VKYKRIKLLRGRPCWRSKTWPAAALITGSTSGIGAATGVKSRFFLVAEIAAKMAAEGSGGQGRDRDPLRGCRPRRLSRHGRLRHDEGRAYLVSDQASYINGLLLYVDGGRTPS